MAELLRVVLADDELIARRRLTRLLEAQPNVEVVGSYPSATLLLEALATTKPDLALLDIQMPELNGLDASALIEAQQGPFVVFVTAHSEHALTAFERGALDYLLKPVDATRLARTLLRVRRAQGGAQVEPSAPERLALATHKGVVFIDVSSIDHAAYDGQLVTLHSAERTFVTDWSLTELEARVPAALLWRVHRRYLLNLNAIQRLEPHPDGSYIAHTKAGAAVPIARQAARMLRRRLGW